MPCQKRPIIIVGAGGIVRDAHLPAYKNAGFEVVGVTDLDRSKAESCARAFEIPAVFSGIEDAIKKAPVFDTAHRGRRRVSNHGLCRSSIYVQREGRCAAALSQAA